LIAVAKRAKITSSTLRNLGCKATRSEAVRRPFDLTTTVQGALMGMPSTVSFYPLVYNLASPDRPYHSTALRLLSPFSLFAFVLCPPDEKDGVRDVLARHFSFLDIATADRLLFFAPIDEPPGWREQKESGSAARSLIDFQNVVSSSVRSADPGQTAHAMAVSLGLEVADLPAIVVTADPRQNQYLALRTSADRVRQQLVGLGDFAQDLPTLGRRAASSEALKLRAEDLRRRGLDLAGGLSDPELTDNLAAALHTVLSFALVGSPHSHSRYASQSARSALDNLRDRITRARAAVQPLGGEPGSEEDDSLQAVLHLEECLATWLGLTAKPTGEEGGPAAPEGWDPEPTRWLILGDRVARLLAAPEPGNEDCSPAAVCWAKAFEAELNLSLGHWVRRLLGVSLPEYFGKVQEGVHAVFSGGGDRFSVDFNRRRRPGDDAWRSLELGVLRGPVGYYLGRETPPLPTEKRAALLEAWETIRQVRNDACHPQAVSHDRAALLRETLRALERGAVLRDLTELKRSLRGSAAPAEQAGPAEVQPPAEAVVPPPAPKARRWWQFWG
jgi:hypothetical protein